MHDAWKHRITLFVCRLCEDGSKLWIRQRTRPHLSSGCTNFIQNPFIQPFTPNQKTIGSSRLFQIKTPMFKLLHTQNQYFPLSIPNMQSTFQLSVINREPTICSLHTQCSLHQMFSAIYFKYRTNVSSCIYKINVSTHLLHK